MRIASTIAQASAQFLFGAALLMAAARYTDGQAVNADSLRRAQQARVDQYRAQVAAAARVFLDGNRASVERLNAVREISTFLDQQQFARAMRVALSSSEPVAIRVRALQLVGESGEADTTFTQQIGTIAIERGSPAEVRAEAVRQLAARSFELHGKPPEFVAALRVGARDPDIAVRRVALRALAGHGDSVALALLRSGLESPGAALVPPAEAVTLLGLKDPSPFFDLLNQIMTQSRDSEVRAAAIQLLGAHERSRPQLVVALRDPRESPVVRHAALGALSAGDARNFPRHVLPVVADESAPLDLRLRGIKFVELSRTSRDPKVFARSPDDFDQLMIRLAESSTTPAVRAAARTYLTRTRSPR